MIMLKLIMDGDGAWPDLDGKEIKVTENIELAVLDHGTVQGKPTVGIRINLLDGEAILAQTSVLLFLQAAQIIHAKYPDILVGH